MGRLRNCPFCKKDVNHEIKELNVHYNKMIGKWIFFHTCSPRATDCVNVCVYGDSEQEVIDKWNGVYEDKTSESL